MKVVYRKQGPGRGIRAAADGFTLLVFLLLFFFSVRSLIVDEPFSGTPFSPAAAVLLLGIDAALLLMLVGIAGRTLEEHCEHPERAVFVMALLLFALQTAVILFGHFKPRNDLSYVVQGAKNIILKGTAHLNDGMPKWDKVYFYTYANNRMILILITGLLRLEYALTGSMSNLLPEIVNAVGLNLSYVFIYLIAAKLYGKRRALGCACYGLLLTPLVTYAAFFYTDTMAMPWMMASVYAFVCWLQAGRHGGMSWLRRTLLLLASVFLLAVAYEIKGSAGLLLPVYGAFILSGAAGGKWKTVLRYAVYGLASVLAFAVLTSGLNRAMAQSLQLDPAKEEKYEFPMIHWVMMSASGSGGYSGKDYRYTRSYKGIENKKLADLERLKEKLKEQGMHFCRHLMEKVGRTWSDGSFMAAHYMNRTDVFDSNWFTVWAAVSHFAMMMLMILSAVRAVVHPSKDRSRLFRTALLMLALFLVVWESKSRYVVLYLPFMALIEAPDFRIRGLGVRNGRRVGAFELT